jgi:hypothetical protein
MDMTRGAVLAGLLLLVVGCGTKRVEVVITPEMKEVAGQWTFNQADSDDSATVADRMRDAMRQRGPAGGPPGGGRGGFPGSGGPEGRPGGPPPSGGRGRPPGGAGPQEAMGNLFRAPSHLTIGIGDSTVTFDEHDGVTRSLYMDGRSVEEKVGPNIEGKTRAFWEGRSLVVEREMGRGMKVREEYFVEQVEHRLHVVLQLTAGQGGKVQVLRMYDPG